MSTTKVEDCFTNKKNETFLKEILEDFLDEIIDSTNPQADAKRKVFFDECWQRYKFVKQENTTEIPLLEQNKLFLEKSCLEWKEWHKKQKSHSQENNELQNIIIELPQFEDLIVNHKPFETAQNPIDSIPPKHLSPKDLSPIDPTDLFVDPAFKKQQEEGVLTKEEMDKLIEEIVSKRNFET